MAVLSDRDIKSRLISAANLDLPNDWRDRVSQKRPPQELVEALRNKKVLIDPFPDLSRAMGSSTLDLQLGYEFRMVRMPLEITSNSHETTIHKYIAKLDGERVKLLENDRVVSSPGGGAFMSFHLKDGEAFLFPTNHLIIPFTFEWVGIPTDLQAQLQGRSRYARLGIVNNFAPRIDAGFIGPIATEIKNEGPNDFLLRPLMYIASLQFEELSSPVDTPYWDYHDARFLGQGQH